MVTFTHLLNSSEDESFTYFYLTFSEAESLQFFKNYMNSALYE